MDSFVEAGLLNISRRANLCARTNHSEMLIDRFPSLSSFYFTIPTSKIQRNTSKIVGCFAISKKATEIDFTFIFTNSCNINKMDSLKDNVEIS